MIRKFLSNKSPIKLYTAMLYISPLLLIIVALISSAYHKKYIAMPELYSVVLLIPAFFGYLAAWIYDLKSGINAAFQKNGEYKDIRCLTFKLLQLPYNIIYFIACVLISRYIFIPLAMMHLFMVMLSTSIHGIAQAIKYKRAGIISDIKATIIIILLLIFILDFVGANMLARTSDKLKKENSEVLPS